MSFAFLGDFLKKNSSRFRSDLTFLFHVSSIATCEDYELKQEHNIGQ